MTAIHDRIIEALKNRAKPQDLEIFIKKTLNYNGKINLVVTACFSFMGEFYDDFLLQVLEYEDNEALEIDLKKILVNKGDCDILRISDGDIEDAILENEMIETAIKEYGRYQETETALFIEDDKTCPIIIDDTNPIIHFNNQNYVFCGWKVIDDVNFKWLAVL
jgi:hypothetical protein